MSVKKGIIQNIRINNIQDTKADQDIQNTTYSKHALTSRNSDRRWPMSCSTTRPIPRPRWRCRTTVRQLGRAQHPIKTRGCRSRSWRSGRRSTRCRRSRARYRGARYWGAWGWSTDIARLRGHCYDRRQRRDRWNGRGLWLTRHRGRARPYRRGSRGMYRLKRLPVMAEGRRRACTRVLRLV